MATSLLELKPPPLKPGVYQFKDTSGVIIYIGKAKILRKRVGSYFRASKKNKLKKHAPHQSETYGIRGDFKTWRLRQAIADVDYIITDTELEALILESALIKKHKPKYNIQLRDDKDYQFIKIDYARPIAKIFTVRRRGERAAAEQTKYFGPFTSGGNVRNTIRLIKRIFPYCQAEKIGKRPCFNYQLHRCPGVCIGLISPQEYRQTIQQIELFLKGKNDDVKKLIKKQMQEASRKHLFEKAANLRDQLAALAALTDQQKVISIRLTNQDYISLFRHANKAAINLFVVRGGRLLGKENMLMENVAEKADGDVLAAFLESYYFDAANLPKQIFLETNVADSGLFTKFLKKRWLETTGKRQTLEINVPKRGLAKKLIALGKENAHNYLTQQLARFEKEENVISHGLAELQKILKLPKRPERIECYDISNIGGTSAVGSMVVMKDGKPDKNQYRKFKIRTKQTPDDYAMMKEILSRRLRQDWPKAQLWVMDGGAAPPPR